MKAVIFDDYGGPEAMHYGDAPDPECGPGDVLVEVHAAGLNPLDWKMREGYVRAFYDLAFPHVGGRDFSGVVREVGADVTGVAAGDEVYGTGAPGRWGPQADLIATPAELVAAKPTSLSHVEAASLPICGLTTLTALELVAPVGSGQKILIHAGAGGVGSFAIQYAKNRGADVTTTTSAANTEYVRELGAATVIDYRTADFTALPPEFDIVFDTMGGAIHNQSFKVLKPGATIVCINADPIEGDPPRDDVEVKKSQVFYQTSLLDRLSAVMESGAVKPQVTATYPLADAINAYNASQTGHARGKTVLVVR